MNGNNIQASGSDRLTLADLNQVEFSPQFQRLFDRSLQNCGGSAAFRARKKAEAHDLLAICQLAPQRLQILELDVSQALRAALYLRAPVPCRSKADGPLEIEQGAMLGLIYREESFRKPTPGYAFIQVLTPRPCWHANISDDPIQVLCLGPQLPAGIRVKDLVLMTYGALSMQTVQFDELDPVGVLNRDAALWWQQTTVPIPLSKEPFLSVPNDKEVADR